MYKPEFKKTNFFLIIIGIVLIIMYYNYIPIWISEWANFDSFYAFGFFLIAFIIYLVVKHKDYLINIPKEPSRLGFLILIPSIILYVIGVRASINYFVNLSFPILISGMILTIYGRKLFLITLIPIILFAFSLPIFPLHRLTMPLQLLSSTLSTKLIRLMGVPSYNEGSIINIGHYRLSVVAGCSGLKSLSSLIFISIIYSYFIRASVLKKLIFISISFPLAIIMNIFRITIVSFYALYNGYAGIDEFHNNLGIVTFITSIALITLISRFIDEIPGRNTL